jgi:O-antigen chain-terminating methyltransferase
VSGSTNEDSGLSDLGDERFYQAFMEKFRGSEAEILRRFWVYDDFVSPIAEHRPAARALDLGCGRGEFLGFLKARGIDPVGVDFDAVMLEAAEAHGYKVVCADGLNYIASLPDRSLHVVAAFHVIEHLTHNNLCKLVGETLRVLAPGGILIFETPNPESLIVSTHNFYYDPTHLRPLPPAFMRFMIELEGNARSTILRLQHPPDIETRQDVGLTEAIFNVSPDYAIVAQKRGDAELETALDVAFERPLGFDLYSLTRRHDMYLDRRFAQLSAEIGATMQHISDNVSLRGEVLDLKNHVVELRSELDELRKQLSTIAEPARSV